VSSDRLHQVLLRELSGLRRPDGGFPISVDGSSEVEPTVVSALALRDSRARGWLETRQRSDGGFDELDGRVCGPTSAALAALALTSRKRAKRALAFAIERRGLPLPNASDPERRVGWGWTGDARSLTEPTSRVLLAVNALTPTDRRTRAEGVGLLAARQCDDGGWNFGNASVYDVDLRGYAQTTAIALIALQGEHPSLVEPGLEFLRRRWRDEPGGLTAAQSRGRPRASARGARVDGRSPVVPRASADGRVGVPGDRPRQPARAAEVASVSLSRRDLLIRSGAAAAWVAGGGLVAAHRLGAFDGPPPFDRAAFPEPGRSAVSVLRADSYDGNLEGLLFDGLRSVEANVRGRSVLLKPNLVEFVSGSSVNTDPRLVVAAANVMRRLGASSVVVAEGPGHRRDTEAVAIASGLREALDDAGLRFVDLNDAPLVRTPLRTRYTGLNELWVPRVLRETEVVVSMPKLKTHHWVGVTLSLKNCFGCMPGRVYGWPKDVFHVRGIPESIVDIAAAVRPSLAIIDGVVGMQGDGPINGDPVQSGVVIVSRDPVAADVTGARLMGMDPERVPYLMDAGEFLGQARSELIEQRGEDPSRLAKAFRPAPGFEDLVA
jgi:uncharacterized protein (DUF362 family)